MMSRRASVTLGWIGVTMLFVVDLGSVPRFLTILAYDLLGGTRGCWTRSGGVIYGFETLMFVLG